MGRHKEDNEMDAEPLLETVKVHEYEHAMDKEETRSIIGQKEVPRRWVSTWKAHSVEHTQKVNVPVPVEKEVQVRVSERVEIPVVTDKPVLCPAELEKVVHVTLPTPVQGPLDKCVPNRYPVEQVEEEKKTVTISQAAPRADDTVKQVHPTRETTQGEPPAKQPRPESDRRGYRRSLLVQSGDVETNPGPVMHVQVVRKLKSDQYEGSEDYVNQQLGLVATSTSGPPPTAETFLSELKKSRCDSDFINNYEEVMGTLEPQQKKQIAEAAPALKKARTEAGDCVWDCSGEEAVKLECIPICGAIDHTAAKYSLYQTTSGKTVQKYQGEGPTRVLMVDGTAALFLVDATSQFMKMQEEVERRRPPSVHMSKMGTVAIEQVKRTLGFQFRGWKEAGGPYERIVDPRSGTPIAVGKEVEETPTVVQQFKDSGFGAMLDERGLCLRDVHGVNNLLDYSLPGLDVRGTTDVLVLRKEAATVPTEGVLQDIRGCIELKTVDTFPDSSSLYQAYLQLVTSSSQADVPTVQGLTDALQGYVFSYDLRHKKIKQIKCPTLPEFLTTFIDELDKMKSKTWESVPTDVWGQDGVDDSFAATLPPFLAGPVMSHTHQIGEDEPVSVGDCVAGLKTLLLQRFGPAPHPLTPEALAMFS